MSAARALVGCERSGVMRRALERHGFEAWSCDIEAADDGSNRHIRGDLRDHLRDGWDLLAVMHPPCTRLCNSGVRWLYIGGRRANGLDPAGWHALEDAAAFYRTCRDEGDIAHRALENPVMHGHAIELTGRGPVQFVQPWWFGDAAFKATGLELIQLPRLRPTKKLRPPKPGTDEHKRWSCVHRHSGWGKHGVDRARARSETFPGFADAAAQSWAAHVMGAKAP
jgi:hypothetical protein